VPELEHRPLPLEELVPLLDPLVLIELVLRRALELVVELVPVLELLPELLDALQPAGAEEVLLEETDAEPPAGLE
jgi:hypothetical protein